MASENQDPYDQAYWGKGKGKKGKKGKSKFQYPYDGNKGYPSYDNGKGKGEQPCSTNIDILEQGTVPILLSIGQMRNLHMTIEHTPQCDKITCKAFGMNHQAVPARYRTCTRRSCCKSKGLTNYQFPSRDHSVSEQVCAPKETEAKEETATLSSRITGYSTRRTRSSSVCTSRLARHCSRRREQRSVRLILTTSAESVQRKSLMHPKVGIQKPLKTIGDLHPRRTNH